MKNIKTENPVIIKNTSLTPIRNKILIVTPTLGIVRIEWCQARYGQTIPCNWSAAGFNTGLTHAYPLGYLTADGQNIAVNEMIKGNHEWLLLIEDDTCPPPDAFLRLNEYMKSMEVPVVSGLYFLKGNPTEPLIYRGRGNASYNDFKIGDMVWADGVPTGFLLIHSSILKVMYNESPEYQTGLNQVVRKVFETPSKVWIDPETNQWKSAVGTSDLYWCDRVMKDKVFERSGWKKYGKMKYPFLVDTNLYCKHIDLSSGIQYPIDDSKWRK